MRKTTSNKKHRGRALGTAFGITLLVFVLLVAIPSGATVPQAVTDISPNASWVAPVGGFVGPWGGRVNALAVNPVNPQIVYAAGEFGGLWRSTDNAAHWSHVDDVPLPFTTDVAIATSDPNLIIVTGEYDGRIGRTPPIWRSADGGVTWSQPVQANRTCGEPSAYHVAIAPGTPGSLKVYVAGNCGLWFSADSGATWSLFEPTALPGRLWDVQARDVGGATQVDICGDNGFARSSTGGGTNGSYAAGSDPLIGAAGPCTLATAPQNPNIVYITVAGPGALGMLKQSLDGGASWTDLQVNNDDKNGRPPFVVTHPGLDGNANHFEVYMGDSVRLIHQRCDATALPSPCAAGSANWTLAAFDDNHAHGDPTDIVFDPTVPNGCPLLTSNDGGVFKTTVAPDSCADTYDWIDANIGLHGYEIRSLAGTVQLGGPALYFGTQDDGLYVSVDGGAHYSLGEIADDVVVLADHTAPGRVLWINGAGGVRVADAGLANIGAFNLASGTSTDADLAWTRAITQFGPQSYAVVREPTKDAWEVEVTTDEGAHWSVMGPVPLPGAPADPMAGGGALGSFDGGGALGAPVLNPIAASGPANVPTFYLLLKVGGKRAIYRLSGPLSGAAMLTPANLSLDNPATFAVDPANPLLLYAFDVASDGSPGRIMRSTNGGASWTEDTALTSLITRSNQFKLSSTSIGALVSSIAFDPNSDTIMVGTETAGIFASTDGGQRWFSVRGAELIPRISGFFFDESSGAIYASSAGRGLWKIVLPKADLSVTKTDSPDPVLAGNELYYNVTVANAGPDAAGAVTVTDMLPADLDFVTSTLPCTASGSIVVCDVGDLAVGQSISFTIKTAVHADAIATTGPKTIVNNVSVASGDTVDLLTNDDSATTPTIVEDSADLEVTKLCKPDTSPQAGQPIDCSVFVDNHGPSYARAVVVDDTMLAPGSFQVMNITATQGSCTSATPVIGGQKLECSLGNLAAASTSSPGRAVISYRITSSEGQDIDNVAIARSDTPDPNDMNNKATVALTVSAVADLGLTKSGPTTATAGTTISWTINISNAGPSTAKNVLVSDDVPAGVTITSVSAFGGSCLAGTPGDSSMPTTCAFDSLAPVAARTMTVQATIKPSTIGTLNNDARVSSATFDANNANDLGHVDTTVQTSADLALGFSADSATYKSSSTIHYRLTVTDNGPSDAVGVVATVKLPSAKTGYYVKDSGGCILSNTTLTCQLGTLAAGAPAKEIFIDYLVQGAKGTVTSSASVTSVTPDPNTANNAATVSVEKR